MISRTIHFLLPLVCIVVSTWIQQAPVAGASSSIHSHGYHDAEMTAALLTGSSAESRCEEITIPMCLNIGYNATSMPNDLNHQTQTEAGLEAHQLYPLVEIKCSPDIRFFLCSIYVPICLTGYTKRLPPCRHLCQSARAGCEPIMNQYNFPWPESMDCDRFPVFGASPDQLCMGQNDTSGSHTTLHPKTTARPKVPGGGGGRGKGGGGRNGPCSKNSKNCTVPSPEHGGGDPRADTGGPKECRCYCQHPLVPFPTRQSSSMTGQPITGVGIGRILSSTNGAGVIAGTGADLTPHVASVPNCAHPCRDTYFNADEKEFANVWITLWSGLCAASTLMTLTTFCIDTGRFKYPERPIVLLSGCYFLVAVGYLIRVAVGHDAVACQAGIIRYSSTEPNICTLVFLLVYFFGMASSIWWVILSFTWFLAAGLKWSNEAITSYSQYFHLAAWLIPMIQTLAVLLHKAVDGDPVAGICSVGNMNMDNLKTFVLGPLIVYLLLGTTFLMAGFVSLFRIRKVIKKQQGGAKADKLEKLMIRIGIFSVLYTVPASIVIGCHLYEYSYHEQWMRAVACACPRMVPQWRPLYSVLMLKYFMALAVGITSGVWIWSGKTVESWRHLWRRMFGGRPDPSGANAVLIKSRPGGGSVPPMCSKIPPQYVVMGGGGGVMGGVMGGSGSAAGSGGSASGGILGCSASLLGPMGGGSSVASASHHHLHHHVLKQPPLTHV